MSDQAPINHAENDSINFDFLILFLCADKKNTDRICNIAVPATIQVSATCESQENICADDFLTNCIRTFSLFLLRVSPGGRRSCVRRLIASFVSIVCAM